MRVESGSLDRDSPAGRSPLQERFRSLLLQRAVRGPAMLFGGRVLQLANSLLISIFLVRRFGLATVGIFALGFVAMTVVGLTASFGLSTYLPRLAQPHARSCASALALQLLTSPLWVAAIFAFAAFESPVRDERVVIVLVGSSGILVALTNTGLMLSIMQERFGPGLFAPLCETAAVVLGGLLSRTAGEYAGALLLGRTASSIAVWWGLRREAVTPRSLVGVCRQSAPYMLPDALAMLSEQVIPLTLASTVTRAQLGMFRLCQQLLTAADTPGWSFVQAHYPALVAGRLDASSQLPRQITRLGAAASILCLGGSVFLAYFVFRVPAVAPMMVVLACTLVWRYRNNLYDQALRASGWVGNTIALGAGKLLFCLVLAIPLVRTFQVWGGVASLALMSICSGMAYKNVYNRRANVAGVRP